MASQVQFPKAEPTVDELLRLDPFEQPESPKEKLFRKLKEQPLVPIGCLLTIGALTLASKHLRDGNRDSFNRALRWRVGFQGLTVVAAMAGTYYMGHSVAAPDAGAGGSSAPVATLPGRPATALQQTRADERVQAEREAWLERVREAERREQKEREEVEAALLRGDAERRGRTAWPTIGQDSRRS